ncbi:AEC family transporter [Rubritalea marina]|uniref:AEC family transporter n=1 Tax=Rubritalea marina TaxID=361055 RepID=UPI00036556B6|nr:AEC family transporter [Rubritalea marina]
MMSESLLVLNALIPVFVVIGVGVLLRKYNVLREEVERGMMEMVVKVLMPALTLANIIGNESLSDLREVGTLVGYGFLSLLVAVLVAYGFAGLCKMKRGNGKRTFAVSAGIQNYGYMGVPLLLSIFNDRELLGVLFTYNVGVELAMWTVGVAMMRGDKKFTWQLVMKPPVIAVFFGLLVNLLGLDYLFTAPVMGSLEMLGAPAIPVALIVIGAGLVELLRKERFDWLVGAGAVLLRLAVLPVLMILSVWLIPVPEELKKVVVVQAAMPAAMFPIVLAKHYGGRPEVAVQVVVATTIVSVVTMPLIVVLGVQFLGL